MDFKIILTLIMVLLGLALVNMVSGRFAKSERTLGDIIASAEAGSTDYLYMTPKADFSLRDYLEAEDSCGGEGVGVEGFSKMYEGTKYLIKAYPEGEGVCLNVTEVV